MARYRKWFASLTLIVTFSFTLTYWVFPTATQASRVTEGFDAGFIISDDKFYGGNSMTVAEIQAFLNQKVPNCTINDPRYPERKAGAKYVLNKTTGFSTNIATHCLKDYKVTTSSKSADNYCGAYLGKSNESAAQIIHKVAQACKINAEVLLVLLEKEMSFITDSWPSNYMYERATGYACPDSGTNNSANCNSEYFGFYNQVYYAARQYQVYKTLPARYNHQVGQNNTIAWHHVVSRGCGNSIVRIENAATAGLYNYTPYRPNQAALDAGWGTGDQCSSYGNRNFFSLYKAWFGQPNLKFPIHASLQPYATANKSWLGNPVAKAVSSNGGVYQEFSGGIAFLANNAQATGMTTTSPILKAYRSAGFVTGSWGWPLSPAENNQLQFTNGLTVQVGSQAHFIPKSIQAYWESTGGVAGPLGAPAGGSSTANGATQQPFAKGLLVRDKSGAFWTIDARFRSLWEKAGGVSSQLGTPVQQSATRITANGGGYSYAFTGGTLYESSAGTFTLTSSRLHDAYRNSGGPSGNWGWPTAIEKCAASGAQCTGTFSNGIGVWTSLRGTQFTPFTSIPKVQDDKNANRDLIGGPVR